MKLNQPGRSKLARQSFMIPGRRRRKFRLGEALQRENFEAPRLFGCLEPRDGTARWR